MWSQELLIFLFIFLYLGSQVWRFLTLVSFFHKHFLLCISWIIIYNSRSYGQKGKEIKIQKIKKEKYKILRERQIIWGMERLLRQMLCPEERENQLYVICEIRKARMKITCKRRKIKACDSKICWKSLPDYFGMVKSGIC